MITNNDLSTLTISPTNKDYYQIWNELLDVAGKLSERWDPTSTNESDPGIVLLKVLTAIADKLNYNVDKNILEAFMPTAAQMESMRKLCDMMGYNISYYRSAACNVTITYVGSKTETDLSNAGLTELTIPKFTVFTNNDQDINFISTKDKILSVGDIKTVTIPCIQGSAVPCETNDGGIITAAMLNDDYKYYLPETQIAENGIFVYNASKNDSNILSEPWEAVGNLNTVRPGNKVYKFGFDSRVKLPYIQFPSDIADLINDGLYIYYTRTNGANGNIASRTLSSFTLPTNWVDKGGLQDSDFIVLNPQAAIGGKNIETITQAYNNFKKTVGTFDTLVTCRDYMNYIYRQMDFNNSNIPLVSNIIASDIRDDLNRAVTICEFTDYGLCYVNKAKTITTTENDASKTSDRVNHFDLVLYPFKTVLGLNTYNEFVNSFKYTDENLTDIEAAIENSKTLAHSIITPQHEASYSVEGGRVKTKPDITCIKNYVRLTAKITTLAKVDYAEELLILSNIKEALYKTFNMRQVDFGEEIPFDSILECIQQADTRIKNVSLDEPELITKIALNDDAGTELLVTGGYATGTTKAIAWADYSADLIVRNVLAGKIQLFNYDTAFENTFDEQKVNYIPNVTKIAGTCTIKLPIASNGLTLETNEVVSFRIPNLKTTITYPAYVNYYLKLYTTAEGTTTYKYIPADTDYQLKAGEYLFINYTPAGESVEFNSNQQAKPINIVYKENDIIKPNFDLYDSYRWCNGGVVYSVLDSTTSKTVEKHTPSKTNGYIFVDPAFPADGTGMFAFGVDEQVEIKERVKVVLKQAQTYLYWTLTDERTELCGAGESYTLQDGEYLFYTDQNKLEMAYYGAGTEISSDIALKLAPAAAETRVDVEKIMEFGTEAVPWQLCSLSDDKKVTINEYSYITLTEGDTLNTITPVDSNNHELTNKWIEVHNASYTLLNDTNATKLPAISLDGIKWQARSSLNLDFGPSKYQKIRTISDKVQDCIAVTSNPDDEPINIVADNGEYRAVKSSYTCQTAADSIDTSLISLHESTAEATQKFIVKHFNYVPAIVKKSSSSSSDSNSSPLQTANFNNVWTKVAMADYKEVDLSICLGRSDNDSNKGCYGLLMIYLANGAELVTARPYLQAFHTNDDGTTTAVIDAFTIYNNNDSWWDDSGYIETADVSSGTSTSTEVRYHLRNGINIVKIINPTVEQSGGGLEPTTEIKLIDTVKIISPVTTGEAPDVVIFSTMDTILCEEASTADEYGLNLAKFWPDSTPDSAAESILNKIKDIDPDLQFYYNCPMNNSTSLDLNSKETLLSPAVWYDYNNINNKFVISEIDADYLTTGITIAKSSKLNR